MIQDEIKRLEDEEKSSKTRKEEEAEPRAVRTVVKDKKTRRDATFSLPMAENIVEAKSEPVNGKDSLQRDWIYVVEGMRNISSYQVTLWPKKQGETLPNPDELNVSMQYASKGNTMVILRKHDVIVFSAQFPGRLLAAPGSRNVVQRHSECLSLRLQSHDSFDDALSDSSSITSLAAVRSICCQYCDQALLDETGKKGIQKVLPLPKGYWDEVTDYLICYNGVSCRVVPVVQTIQYSFVTHHVNFIRVVYETQATRRGLLVIFHGSARGLGSREFSRICAALQ